MRKEEERKKERKKERKTRIFKKRQGNKNLMQYKE